jgi:poly-gamma-glutamate capsule biosynthesis protein CapA/YwtB (metallophosphatase superfamily)
MNRRPRTARLGATAVFALVFCFALLIGGGARADAFPTATEEPLRTSAPCPTAAPSPTRTHQRACRAWPSMGAPTPEPTVFPRTVTIRAVGDLMAHDKQLRIAKRGDGGYSFYEQYALARESLAAADYTIANLETTIGLVGRAPHSGYPRFNAPEELLAAVKDSGVDFLTLANNHILDRYFDGMVQTADLVEQYGFAFGGVSRTAQQSEMPNIVDVNGVRLGFLCYTQHTNGMERHAHSDARAFGVHYLGDADFQEDVRKLRAAGAEVVIAMPHWGAEYERQPGSYAKNMARRMADAGVDVILGSHPHVVQPMRFLETELPSGGTRSTLVAYSLGNFISNMSRKHADIGIIVEFSLVERAGGGFDIEHVGYVPIFCWRTDSSIQSLPALKYIDAPPPGMNSSRASTMRSGTKALIKLMGDEFPALAE